MVPDVLSVNTLVCSESRITDRPKNGEVSPVIEVVHEYPGPHLLPNANSL